MSDLFWLTKPQMRRIEPYFPLSHGVPRVDDRRTISGIIFVTHPARVPFLNTYRTMCLAPEPGFLGLLEEIRSLRLAA